MKHLMVGYGDFRWKGQAAGLANQDLFADLPMCAVLAFTNQKFDFILIAHLQPPEFLFYFANKIGESSCGNYARLPA
jgi:hypothetical protein